MFKRLVKKALQIKSPLDLYSYSIDLVDDKEIAGWAYKNGDTDHIVNIEIMSDHIAICSTNANIFRNDLKEAGIGNGKYGFIFDVTRLKTSKAVSKIDIFIDGYLANSAPFPLQLQANTKGTPTEHTSIEAVTIVDAKEEESFALEGVADAIEKKMQVDIHLDVVSIERVVGWVKDKNLVDHRSLVELRSNDIIIGCAEASEFREDLKKAGIGDGSHCFRITPLLHLFPSEELECYLYVDGQKIDTKPIKLVTTQEEIEKAVYTNNFSSEIAEFGDNYAKEIARLNDQISSLAQSGLEGSPAISVALENIATLSVRVATIEQILNKYLSK